MKTKNMAVSIIVAVLVVAPVDVLLKPTRKVAKAKRYDRAGGEARTAAAAQPGPAARHTPPVQAQLESLQLALPNSPACRVHPAFGTRVGRGR
jgi:hypothetical protein